MQSLAESSDEEFPALGVLLGRIQGRKQVEASSAPSSNASPPPPRKSAPGVRRRRLGPATGKVLVRPRRSDAAEGPTEACAVKDFAVNLKDTTRAVPEPSHILLGQGKGIFHIGARSARAENLPIGGNKSAVKKGRDQADTSDLLQGKSAGSVDRSAAVQTTRDTMYGWDLSDAFSALNVSPTTTSLASSTVGGPKHTGKTRDKAPVAYRDSADAPGNPVRSLQNPRRLRSDMTWCLEFADDWDEEPSPVKKPSPNLIASPSRVRPKDGDGKAADGKEAKKAFARSKHAIASDFLRELDSTITGGKITELTTATGGVKLNWTNKLCTTAGRATWKRERQPMDAGQGSASMPAYRHFASIELADKVIDCEERLLNVMAHEFCHLANFMVSGVTTNPHGKEFKAWATHCSTLFQHRGVVVTTKHSYEIDFKYVWQCTSCGLQFKRHSKSINVERHRCGSCKSQLQQTKPAPRASGKRTEYQKFMSEQMRLLREERPGSPQKNIMSEVAERWSRVSKLSLPLVKA